LVSATTRHAANKETASAARKEAVQTNHALDTEPGCFRRLLPPMPVSPVTACPEYAIHAVSCPRCWLTERFFFFKLFRCTREVVEYPRPCCPDIAVPPNRCQAARAMQRVSLMLAGMLAGGSPAMAAHERQVPAWRWRNGRQKQETRGRSMSERG